MRDTAPSVMVVPAFALIGTAIHGLETAGALLLARQLLGSANNGST